MANGTRAERCASEASTVLGACAVAAVIATAVTAGDDLATEVTALAASLACAMAAGGAWIRRRRVIANGAEVEPRERRVVKGDASHGN